jgi:hypothetical protein
VNTERPAGDPRDDLSLKVFVTTWWRELFGVDGRFWRTLRLHLRRPGAHAARHLAGDAADLIGPVRFYLVANFVFFLMLPIFNSENVSLWDFSLDSLSEMPPSSAASAAREIERWPAGEAAYRAVFDERVGANQAVYLALVIPLIGTPLWLLLRRRRRYLVEHLHYATGLLTFLLLSLFAVGLAAFAVRAVAGLIPSAEGWALAGQGVLMLAWACWCLVGFGGSARLFYGFRPRWSVPLALVVGLLVLVSFWIYGKLLFWHTLWTLH